MSTSYYWQIQQAVATVIQGLNFTFAYPSGVAAVPVRCFKIPKAEQNLDTLPYIVVSPSINPQDWTRPNFEGNQQVTYKVLVSIIGSGNMDFYSNQDTYSQWYEAIRTAFKVPPLSGVPQVWKTSVAPADIFNRRVLSVNYDYLSLELSFTTIE